MRSGERFCPLSQFLRAWATNKSARGRMKVDITDNA
jgi:hypothetical protein